MGPLYQREGVKKRKGTKKPQRDTKKCIHLAQLLSNRGSVVSSSNTTPVKKEMGGIPYSPTQYFPHTPTARQPFGEVIINYQVYASTTDPSLAVEHCDKLI